jgi:hypothetical protein
MGNKERKTLPLTYFIALLIIELYTSTVIILKLVIPSETYDIVSSATCLPRLAVWLSVSCYIQPTDLLKYYIMLDNLLCLGLISILCYACLLLGIAGVTPDTTDYLAFFSFVLIVFFLNGNFRIMMS